MGNVDYYNEVKPGEIINPKDLLKTFPELVAKAEKLKIAEAPAMLTHAMFSLALEIEINRQNALVVINPENPEPMILPIMAREPRQIEERKKIIKILRKAGWAVRPTELNNFVEISVAKYELAKIETT